MSAAPAQLLPKRTIYYLEYGRLAERVMRDARLCPLARVFILTVAYLTNFKEGPLGWKEIEQYARAGRGTFYWAESLREKRGSSPMQQAIECGYVRYQKSGTTRHSKFLVNGNFDASHQSEASFDASHQSEASFDASHQSEASFDASHQSEASFDASHQSTISSFDASHQSTISNFDASHQSTISNFDASHQSEKKKESPNPSDQLNNSKTQPSVHSDPPPTRAREEREISASGDLGSRRSMHQERDHARASISVHKPVDKPLFRPSGDLEFPRLSDAQLGTMHQMWSEQGIASYEIQDAIELAAKAVVESGIQPFQVVNIVKTLKAHYDPPGWPSNFRKLLDAAIEKRHQPP